MSSLRCCLLVSLLLTFLYLLPRVRLRFVTLDTTSRDDMMNVMLDLRKRTLLGEPVKARLKAAATPTSSFVDTSAIMFPSLHSAPPQDSSPSRNKSNKNRGKKQQNGKPKPSRTRKKNNPNANSKQKQQQQQPPSSPSTPKRQQSEEPAKKKDVATAPPPPKLEEESHFPALASVAVDNIADKDNVDKVAGITKTASTADGASTATTTSNTTSSTASPPVAGGYAAALLKAAPPKDESIRETKVSNSDCETLERT